MPFHRSEMLSMSFEHFFYYIATIWMVVIGWIVYQRFLSPLADVPGPFWASVTRFWYFHRISAGDMHRYTKDLHRQYGPLVRIAPDEVSCSDPEAKDIIYATNKGYTKTDFYLTQAPKLSPHGDSFTELDEKKHTSRRKMINGIFRLESVLESEKYMDNVTRAFLVRMSEFADAGASIDMGDWVHYYTFDVIGELFFGRMFGSVDEGKDVHGYIGAVDTVLPHAIKMGVLPKWQRYIQYLLIFSAKLWNAVQCFQVLEVASRVLVLGRLIDNLQNILAKQSERADMLDKLLTVVKDKEPDFDMSDVYTESYTAIFAGSDTTAIVLRSIIYHLCRNPDMYSKLEAEIDQFQAAGQLSSFVTYAEAIKMPYLMATIKEAMRVHPPIALTFPRHVPKGGAVISGKYFLEGSRVGVNPYVLHYQTSIFGDDAESFNPDRWFRPEASTMDRYMFQFGSGSRGCIGKHVALSAVYKFVPQFLRAFKVELVDPDKEWTEKNAYVNPRSASKMILTRLEGGL